MNCLSKRCFNLLRWVPYFEWPSRWIYFYGKTETIHKTTMKWVIERSRTMSFEPLARQMQFRMSRTHVLLNGIQPFLMASSMIRPLWAVESACAWEIKFVYWVRFSELKIMNLHELDHSIWVYWPGTQHQEMAKWKWNICLYLAVITKVKVWQWIRLRLSAGLDKYITSMKFQIE